MALLIADKLKPKNNGSFALIDAADVEMPDGSRLSEFNPSGVTSWNDLTDKPFHAGDVLYAWNEETEYETLVTEGIPESAPYTSLVKISDDTPESDSLIGKIMYLRSAHGTQQEAVIDESWITSHDGWYMVGGCLLVITAESSTADGITLTRGAWMPDGFDTSFEYALSEVKISDPLVQIDEMFIPDTIARVSDIPEQIVPPVTSVNGQTGDVVIETQEVSWDNLTNKPFQEEKVYYEWDADVEYDTRVALEYPDVITNPTFQYLEKVSDDAPAMDFFIGKTMRGKTDSGGETIIKDNLLVAENLYSLGDGYYGIGQFYGDTFVALFYVVTAESVTIEIPYDSTSNLHATVTTGIWCLDASATNTNVIKVLDPLVQIDEMFIPDTIARVSDIPEQIVPPVTSVNGQTGDVVIETNVSWNDLTDKPFGAEKVYYEWNEETEYETVVENERHNELATCFVKISDDAPDRGYFIGKSCEVHAIIYGEEQLLGQVLSEKHLPVWIDGIYSLPDIGYVVTAETITTDAGTLTKGIWALSGFKDPDIIKILDWKIYDPVSKLDEEFIPDTIARKSDLETITIDQVDPDKVIFPEGLTTTYAIGNVALENGMATLVEPGGTLTDFFNIFVDEKNPSTTQPSVSLTFSQAKAYEVGTEVTPSYSATLNPGSYTYGPATGVTATSWSVSDSDGNTSEEASGSFPKFTVGDDTSYSITAKAQHGEGTIPMTNTKNEYPAGKIASGEKSTTSSKVTGFRKTFYGTTTDKTALSSGTIRGLSGKSSSALANGSMFTVTIPVGAMRVVIAYPATLRDVSSIKDVNGLNAEIASGFTKSTLAVEGVSGYEAIDYKIYTLEYAEANDKANTYTVKI